MRSVNSNVLQYLTVRAETARDEATRTRRAALAKRMNGLSTSGDPHQNLLELATVYKFGEFGIAQPNDDAAVAMCTVRPVHVGRSGGEVESA